MSSRRRLLLAALALALVLLGVLVARASLTTFGPDGQQADASQREALMKRTTQLAAQVMSYNADTAAKDIAAAKSVMTASMRADYERTLPAAADRRRQAGSGVKVEARVSRIDGATTSPCPLVACAAGIVSMTENEASVLVFVNQYATAKSTDKVVVSPTWELIRMVKRDGEWIIARMDAP